MEAVRVKRLQRSLYTWMIRAAGLASLFSSFIDKGDYFVDNVPQSCQSPAGQAGRLLW